jgi:hypothetical protein
VGADVNVGSNVGADVNVGANVGADVNVGANVCEADNLYKYDSAVAAGKLRELYVFIMEEGDDIVCGRGTLQDTLRGMDSAFWEPSEALLHAALCQPDSVAFNQDVWK